MASLARSAVPVVARPNTYTGGGGSSIAARISTRPLLGGLVYSRVCPPFGIEHSIIDFTVLRLTASARVLALLSKESSYTKHDTTLSNGYLGSRNDEERSEMRYVMRIAEFSESSNL